MGTGILANSDLARVTDYAKTIDGDFAEIGVWNGSVFSRLCYSVCEKPCDKRVHAFDSFRGCAEPGENDTVKCLQEGRYATDGGLDGFKQMLLGRGCSSDKYYLWQGFIPECFERVPDSVRFAFCYIDVDQYEPTLQAIEWAWPRISSGGIMGFDDYRPHLKKNAALAVQEFLAAFENEYTVMFKTDNDQIFLVKEA